MDTPQIQQLVQTYEKIKDAIRFTEEGRDIAARLWDLEDCLNPFDSYDLERSVKKIRDALIQTYLEAQTKRLCNNVTISPNKFISDMDKERGELEFDPSLIEEKLRPYIDNRDELAWKEMLDKARRLLPYNRNRDNTKTVQTKGSTLVLELYVDITNYSVYIDPAYFESISALEKAVDVIIYRVKPSMAGSDQLLATLWNIYHMDKKELFTSQPLHAPFKSVKLYKNGRLDLTFAEKEACETVAKALCR